MSLIYLQLARLADEDRLRDYADDTMARRRAALLRRSAACCQRTVAMVARGFVDAVRGRLFPRHIAPACC